MQQVISAKWTADELALMDHLLIPTGAQNRSHLLRLALLALAEDQEAPSVLVRAAERARTEHPYRRTLRTVRDNVKQLVPSRPAHPPRKKRRA